MARRGRPPLPIGTRAVDTTKIVRLPKTVAQKFSSGYYDQLEALVQDYRYLCQDSSASSPRFDRLRQFIGDYETILESCGIRN